MKVAWTSHLITEIREVAGPQKGNDSMVSLWAAEATDSLKEPQRASCAQNQPHEQGSGVAGNAGLLMSVTASAGDREQEQMAGGRGWTRSLR